MSKLLSAPTKNAIQKELSSQLLNTAGVSDPISFDDVDGVPNLPGVLVINRVDSSGVATPSKREYIEYSGTSGTTVLITTRNVDGSNAALTHAVGSIVEWIPGITWASRIYDSLAAVIDVDNNTTLNSSIATLTGTQTLTNKTITTPTINGQLATGGTLTGVTLIDAVGVGGATTNSGSFIYPTQFENLRVFASNASTSSVDYIELENDGTNSLINSGKGHIVLTPATSKLVKFSVLEQNNDATNTYKNNTVVLTGEGDVLGDGATAKTAIETINFGVTFSTTPIVIISWRGVWGTPPTNTANGFATSDLTKSTTQAIFKGQDSQGTTTSAGQNYWYDWMAIGTI